MMFSESSFDEKNAWSSALYLCFSPVQSLSNLLYVRRP